jgi:hypothetical protein
MNIFNLLESYGYLNVNKNSENAIDELMYDIIEIVNPVGEVLEELESKFEEFKKEKFLMNREL